MRIFSRKLIPKMAAVPEPSYSEGHKALVYEDEAKRIANLTLQYPDIETGGSLFGYWTHSGSPIISIASGPGCDSRHHRTSFYQDEAYLHDLGTMLYDQHGLQHVGEWHSHHRMGLNEPSQGDVNTILSGMHQMGWSRFLLLITTIKDPEVGLVLENYFLFSKNKAEPEPLRILTLPGSSPFRATEHVTREEKTRPVSNMTWYPGPFTPGTRQVAQEVFPNSWFTSTDGRARLTKIAQDFRAVGIECRMAPEKDGRKLKLLLGEAALLLGPDFPENAPEWLGNERLADLEPWTASTNLVEWYLRAKEGNKEMNPFMTKRGINNEFDN